MIKKLGNGPELCHERKTEYSILHNINYSSNYNKLKRHYKRNAF